MHYSRLPDHIAEIICSVEYKPKWEFDLIESYDEDGSGGWQFRIVSHTTDSFKFGRDTRVAHHFLIPNTSWNRNVWVAWVFDRVRDVETHEAGEFFRVDGVREFAPHHSNGEDPYRVWHVSDWDTAAKSSGDG